MKPIVVVLLLSVAAYLALCALMYMQQDRILFIGAPPVTPPPDPRIEPIEHIVDGARLRGIRVRAVEERIVLLYFGGNAEPVVSNAAPMLTLPSVTAYLIDYRGYGASEGSPSEPALRADALALFDWIRARHPESRSVLFGRSMGTALALHIAARRSVDGLILVSPFTSLRDVARFHFPWLPVGPLMRNGFDALPDWRTVDPPTLVIAGEDDSIVPARVTADFLQARSRGVEVHVIPGRDHNDLMATASDWALVRGFLDRVP